MARNRPTDSELIDAVTEFLGEVAESESNTPDVRFRLRVAMNVLGIVRRETVSGANHDEQERVALQHLLGAQSADLDELNRNLCEQIRRGDFDDCHLELKKVLLDITMNKLAIDNPRYSTYRCLSEERRE